MDSRKVSAAPAGGNGRSKRTTTRRQWRKRRQFRGSQPPNDDEVSSESGYDVTALGPPEPLERGESFADRSPPGMARSNLSLGMTPLRWAPQQPPKVATVSQIAAPQGWRGQIWIWV